ncbi:hypothetical protein H8356DRAFT_1341274 [Neocallimastix lanati (nom. inval.)]|nr:hypothetical protein H8356DRAFT_1341274 [Neocallimastix sp. JGI-2020a]
MIIIRVAKAYNIIEDDCLELILDWNINFLNAIFSVIISLLLVKIVERDEDFIDLNFKTEWDILKAILDGICELLFQKFKGKLTRRVNAENAVRQPCRSIQTLIHKEMRKDKLIGSNHETWKWKLENILMNENLKQ